MKGDKFENETNEYLSQRIKLKLVYSKSVRCTRRSSAPKLLCKVYLKTCIKNKSETLCLFVSLLWLFLNIYLIRRSSGMGGEGHSIGFFVRKEGQLEEAIHINYRHRQKCWKGWLLFSLFLLLMLNKI